MSGNKVKELEKSLEKLGDEGEEGIGKVDALNDLAFAFYSNDLERTRDYASKAIELAERLQYLRGQAKGYRTLGVYFWLKGDFDKALDSTLKSLRISEKMGDEDGEAASFNNMGLIYMNLGKPELALENHLKASEIFEKVGNKESQGKALTNIGVICEAQGDYERALKYLIKGLELHEELGNKSALAGCHSYIGNCYRGKDCYERALEHFLVAVEISEKANNKLDAVIAYKGLGALYTKLEKYDLALEYLEKGLKLALEMESRHQELSLYRFLLELYEAQKDYKNALAWYKKTHELESKIFSDETAKKIDQLESRYDAEQKEKEAEIYRLKNVELEKMVAERTAELQKELAERRRAEEVQSVLYNISQSISKSDTLRELLESMHKQLGKLLDTSNFYVALYDEKSDTYTFPYEVDEKDVGEDYTPQQLKKSLTDYVRRQGEPLLVDYDLHKFLTDEGFVELVGAPSEVWMGVPLKIGKRVIGIVVVQSYNDNVQYTFEDLDVLTFVADGIALGVERKRAEQELKEKLAVIQKQQDAILELSTPVIKIWDGVLVVPLIGTLDSHRAEHLTEELLETISKSQSRVALIDITGVPSVDSSVANHLLKTVESVRLQGARCVITGIRPEVAQTIIHLGIDISQLQTRSTLSEGLKWAFDRLKDKVKP